MRSLYYPLARLGEAHERHVLQVASPLLGRNEMVRRLVLLSALIALAVIGASFAGSWWLAAHAVRPVHEVIDQAEGIGAGSLDQPISAYADTKEYRRLVDVLNTMLARIHNAFEVQRRFTADASHELRSPLTALRGEIELALRRDRDPDEYRRVLNSSLEEIVRLGRITEDLLTLSRADGGAFATDRQDADARDVAERIVDRFRGGATEKGVSIALSQFRRRSRPAGSRSARAGDLEPGRQRSEVHSPRRRGARRDRWNGKRARGPTFRTPVRG